MGGAHLQFIFFVKLTIFFKRVVEMPTMGCMRNFYRIEVIVFRKRFPSLVHAWSRINQCATPSIDYRKVQLQEQEEIGLGN